MKLWIMRHGPAEDVSASGRDEDRELSRSGRDRTRAVANALVQAGESPLALVTSPLVRARQTADIVASVAVTSDATAISVRSELRPGRDASALVNELAAQGSRRVMLVGHEPDVSALVAALLGEHAPPLLGFDKAMVVGIRVSRTHPLDPTKAALRCVLNPKTLGWQWGATANG